MTENLIVKQLQEIASKLASDPDLQRDLMQEMFVHLIHIETAEPGQTLSWYLKSCEFHARNYLKIDRNIDPAPGADNAVSPEAKSCVNDLRRSYDARPIFQPVNQIEIQGEVITHDVLNLILPLLSDMQQRVLFLLMKGCGVREAARELGITHPAVIKHRKKIARMARELLQESEGIGVAVAIQNGTNENGNGDSSSNGNGNGNGHGDNNGTGHGSDTGNSNGEAPTA